MTVHYKIKSKSKAIAIWGTANLFYLYEVILRVSPSVMTGDLMRHYGITSWMLGVLISFFYYSYTILQIPCGLILDKLGPRNLICASVAMSVIGSLMFVATNHVCIAQIGRFLIGAGGASAFISCLQIASALFPQKHFAVFAGISNMMGTLGALCGGLPIAKSVNTVGWEQTIMYLIIIGLVLMVLAFILIPRVIKTYEDGHHNSFKVVFYKVIGNKQIILSGLVGGFMYLSISAFSELWAVPFFMVKYGIDNETAAMAQSVLFIGFAVGSIPVALIAKKIKSYMKTIRFSIISVAFLFIPLIYVDNIYFSFSVTFFIGVLTAAEVIIFTCAKNNESEDNAGTAIAFANALIMLIGAIFQPLLGILLDLFWSGEMSIYGVRIYEISAYQKSMLTLPICLMIAYILSIFINETMQNEQVH